METKLRCKVETVIAVDMFDLAEFIEDAYGLPGEFEILESDNDVTHRYNGIKKGELNKEGRAAILIKSDQDTIDRAIESGHINHGSLRPLLLDLVERDLIPEGNYSMEVSW